MSKRMSKYICEKCNDMLSSKYALERHTGSARCVKHQRDVAKLAVRDINSNVNSNSNAEAELDLNEGPLYDIYFKSIRDRSKLLTIFKKAFQGSVGNFIKRPGMINFSDPEKVEDHYKYSAILSSSVIGYSIVGKLMLKYASFDQLTSISLYHNGIKIYSYSNLTWDILRKTVFKEDINLLQIAFMDQYIPFQTLSIVVESHTEIKPLKIYYEAYQLSEDETKRFQSIGCEYFVSNWATINVDHDDPELITQLTNAYVCDIICTSDDVEKCEFYPELVHPYYQSTFCHWSSVPENYWIPGTRLSKLDDVLFASLVSPGTKLFKKDTDNPVLVRYLSTLKMMDGKTSYYADLYHENPKKITRDEIKRRVQDYCKCREISEYPIQQKRKQHAIMEKQIFDGYKYNNIYVPVEWNDVPGECELPLYEPNWRVLLSNDDNLSEWKMSYNKIRKCITEPNSEMIKVIDICGIKNMGKLYWWSYKGINYGVHESDLHRYFDLMVPINLDLYKAIIYLVAQTCPDTFCELISRQYSKTLHDLVTNEYPDSLVKRAIENYGHVQVFITPHPSWLIDDTST